MIKNNIKHGACDTCHHDGDLTELDGKMLCPVCFMYQARGYVPINPNCSEVVFKLPGMAKEDALAILKKHGIMEVDIPLKLLSDDEDHDDIVWHVIADRDNPMVPNLDSEYGCSLIVMEDWDGMLAIRGGINLEFSALPTMKKIADAFPGSKWEEVTGGGMTDELAEWVNNGMEYTKRQKKMRKDELKEPGDDTKLAREKIIDPAFDTGGS